jgi:NADH:ubiquinone oxidoreductase subunit K
VTLDIVAVVAALLLLLGLGATLLRRSLIGFLVGIELGTGALVLLTTVLFDLSGTVTSTGQVIAAAAIVFGVAAGVLVVALHLAAVRAGRRTADLEPW